MSWKQPKNICCAKGEVDYSIVTNWFEKFPSGHKNFDNRARSSWPKTVDSEDVLQAIEAYPASSIRRVSGDLSISQFSVVYHLHKLGKSM